MSEPEAPFPIWISRQDPPGMLMPTQGSRSQQDGNDDVAPLGREGTWDSAV